MNIFIQSTVLQELEHGSLRISAHLSWRTGNISMFSTCSELTPRAPIPDGRMERIMQPWQKPPLTLFKNDSCKIMIFTKYHAA